MHRPGKGLPNGALTSQHFGNFYLNALDRYLGEGQRVSGLVRYMDDVAWWSRSRARVLEVAQGVRAFAEEQLSLELKPGIVQRSRHGMTFVGYRVRQGAMRLTARRRRRYAEARARWEKAFEAGEIDERTLQARISSAIAMTIHADALNFRRAQLRGRPALEV